MRQHDEHRRADRTLASGIEQSVALLVQCLAFDALRGDARDVFDSLEDTALHGRGIEDIGRPVHQALGHPDGLRAQADGLEHILGRSAAVEAHIAQRLLLWLLRLRHVWRQAPSHSQAGSQHIVCAYGEDDLVARHLVVQLLGDGIGPAGRHEAARSLRQGHQSDLPELVAIQPRRLSLGPCVARRQGLRLLCQQGHVEGGSELPGSIAQLLLLANDPDALPGFRDRLEALTWAAESQLRQRYQRGMRTRRNHSTERTDRSGATAVMPPPSPGGGDRQASSERRSRETTELRPSTCSYVHQPSRKSGNRSRHPRSGQDKGGRGNQGERGGPV
mmetsp:Transcript_96927/g.278433  ORF Transcript_96927/g.278433 Transcript_96927/m.278433 type:complete len:332 (+) Transcript_96927:887-1882(+)